MMMMMTRKLRGARTVLSERAKFLLEEEEEGKNKVDRTTNRSAPLILYASCVEKDEEVSAL